jgi:Raf kinase inhibitor-like YbhB/YbcL family protein
MKKMYHFLVLLLMFSTCGKAQTFTLMSEDLGGQATSRQWFKGLGANGENLSPQLHWEHPPAGTRSFALTMYDPTAPTGSGWWHWVVFDIPASVSELKEGAGTPSRQLLPAGAIQGMGDLGQPGYMGPAPPQGSGIHQYILTVYALKVDKLGLDQKAGPALVGFYLNANAIQKASIVLYGQR